MADDSFGKNTDETSSSYIPLNTQGRKQPNPKSSPKKQTSSNMEVPENRLISSGWKVLNTGKCRG